MLSKIRITLLTVIIPVLLLSVVFTGCSKEEEPVVAAEVVVEAPSRTDGPLSISMGSSGIGKINFNPFAPGRTSIARNLIYEPLFVFDTAQGPEEIPWLSTEYSMSKDLKSITFSLRKNVKWNDGEIFDADDVVFTFETVAANPAMDRYSVLPYFESITKNDDFSVTINLKKPSSLAQTIFGVVNMIPQHTWVDIEDPATFLNDVKPIATGPFTEVEKAEVNVLTVLGKNPHYWMEGKELIDSISMPHNKGEANDFALINEDVHWGNAFIPDVENTYTAASPNNHTSDGDNGMQVLLFMNHDRPVTGDLAFRQAVSQAIDYKQILDIIFYGKSQLPQPTGLSKPFHEKWGSSQAQDLAKEMGLGIYDPEQAIKTLDAAGYKDVDGDGIREAKDGSPLAPSITVVGGFTDFVGTAQIIIQNLLAVGLEVQINAVDFGQAYGAMMTAEFDMAIWFGTMEYSPWNFFRNEMDGNLITSKGALGENFARWDDSETNQLLDAFVSTQDYNEQKVILGKLQIIYTKNIINVPVFTRFTTAQYNDSVFTGFPTNENYYASSGPGAYESTRLRILTEIRYKGKK